MKNTKMMIMTALAILVLSMISCNRTASRPPVITATSESDFPFPISTQPNVMQEIFDSTATAISLAAAAPEKTTEPKPVEEEPKPPPSEPEIPSTYKLQSGEWPTCIARRYNLNLTTLLAINGLSMDSKPGVGTVLQIPQDSEWSSVHGNRQLRTHPADYTVQAGDTVYGIACYFGDVTPQAILDANGVDGTKVEPGTVLYIP